MHSCRSPVVMNPGPAGRSPARGPEGGGPAPRGPWLGLVLALLPAMTLAQDPNACDEPGEAPDVIVAELHNVQSYGSLGGITSFSVGTVSCNLGTCWAKWIAGTNEHPVIAQNMYRLKDGRFEHIGQSWVKHGFFTQSGSFCSNDCIQASGSYLGVNCSDAYTSGLNGEQIRLGPRSEVNAATGEFLYPFTTQGQDGDLLYKRLQVHNDDLDPALNPGALYFVEAQYITADDALAGNGGNNSSYRPIQVTGSAGVFDISLTGQAVPESPAVTAWEGFDPSVRGSTLQVPLDGRFLVRSSSSDLGNGMWSYEYAVHNLDSNRAGGSFRVPLPPGAQVGNIGFHDVDYHSGEPYDGADWTGQVVTDPGGTAVAWAADSFAANPDANALRWGTLYNFRFDADVPPVLGEVALGLFLPGSPAEVLGQAMAPSLCNNDGVCAADETCSDCADCFQQIQDAGFCDDGRCDPGLGEDCVSCPEDCNGRQQGNPNNIFCCGDGDGENPVGCFDSRCISNGFDCGGGILEFCCGDGTCDPVEASCTCAADCGAAPLQELACDDGLDEDCDGATDCADLDCCTDAVCAAGIDSDGDGVAECDCDDSNDRAWSPPGEVPSLELSPDGLGATTLEWEPPSDLGGVSVTYDVLRSVDGDFVAAAVCLPSPDPSATTSSDADLPPQESCYYYLVRAVNECPVPGTLGVGSAGGERVGLICP